MGEGPQQHRRVRASQKTDWDSFWLKHLFPLDHSDMVSKGMVKVYGGDYSSEAHLGLLSRSWHQNQNPQPPNTHMRIKHVCVHIHKYTHSQLISHIPSTHTLRKGRNKRQGDRE